MAFCIARSLIPPQPFLPSNYVLQSGGCPNALEHACACPNFATLAQFARFRMKAHVVARLVSRKLSICAGDCSFVSISIEKYSFVSVQI